MVRPILCSFTKHLQDLGAVAEVLTKGLPASPGAATGKLAFTAEEAVQRSMADEKVLLVRSATSPEDVDGMHHAVGILTSTGGMTSHAAVVARGWGKCCVAGAGDLLIDTKRRRVTVKGQTFTHADSLSIDGTTGEVIAGEVQRGILICGTGIGASIAANKIPGIRAALAHDEAAAELSRRHNDANVLCLAGDELSDEQVFGIVDRWLADPFDGGRVLSLTEALGRIEEIVGRPVPRTDDALPPANHRQWIERILRNLESVFLHRGRVGDARAMMELRGLVRS